MNSDMVWPLGKKAAIGILAISVLVGCVDFIDRLIISSLYPYLKEAYNLTDTELGLLSGIVNFTVAVLIIPGGYLVDRWSRKKMIAIMMCFWALGSGFSAVATTFAGLFAARFLIGFGEAAYTPATQSLLAASFPMRWRTTAVTMQQYGAQLGSMIGIGLGAFIAARWGWQHALGIMCIPGLIVGLSALFLHDFPNQPRQEGQKQASWFSVIKKILTTPSLLCVYLSQSIKLGYTFTLSIWFLTYLTREGGMSVEKAGTCSVIMLLCSSSTLLISGPINDWLRSKSRILSIRVVACLLLTGLVLSQIALLALEPGSIAQVALLIAVPLVCAPLLGLGFALNADLTRPETRGTAVSIMTLSMNIIGTGGGPIILGALSDHFGLSGALTIMSYALGIAAVLYLILSKTYSRDLAKVQ